MGLKDKTYGILKDRIINCVYPPGSILKEREIITELGVSRTPFREAANALMHEDLVALVPYKGVVVAEITLRDIENLYAVRERLEVYALELSMGKIPESELRGAIGGLQAGWQGLEAAIRQDEEVHTMLLHYAGNKVLERLVDGLYDHVHRIRVMSAMGECDGKSTNEEHLRILQPMLEGDLEAAAAAMKAHINGSKQRAVDTLMRHNDKLYFRP